MRWMPLLLPLAALACAPKPPPPPQPLEGTVWTLAAQLPDVGAAAYAVRLDPEGRLVSFSPRDNTPDNDRWAVHDRSLVLEMNDGYVVYTAWFSSPELAQGEATNTRGERWAFTLTRAP